MGNKIIETMRLMKLAEVKGGLRAVLQCYWEQDQRFEDHEKLIEEIIEKIEGYLE